ncbi:hypothetical protein IKF92_02075 [Candidatus Saccharibacteria bacterium]|nr:hypothetical protein [Candidatus Saccharibacteria bacterium]
MVEANIQQSTIGYDTQGVDDMLREIKTKVILEAAEEMKTSVNSLNEAIDSIWVGTSADQFKQNMQSDVTKISRKLEESYNVLESRIWGIVSSMSEADQNLIKSRV